jgi:hypothetical protein
MNMKNAFLPSSSLAWHPCGLIQDANAQFCSTSGNVVIFANYDGGNLTINVDENIPNLKIGICSYEAVPQSRFHWHILRAMSPLCSTQVSIATTIIVIRGDQQYHHQSACLLLPSQKSYLRRLLLSPHPEGYSSIICAYSCDTDWQGGCNTALNKLWIILKTSSEVKC